MYAGREAEEGPVDAVISRPSHPYTKGLIACVPHLTERLDGDRPELVEIPGIVPPLAAFGRDACLFASRCAHASGKCRSARPPPTAFEGRRAACWHTERI